MRLVSRLLIVLATLTLPLSCSAKVLGSCRGSPDLARCTLLQKPFHLDGVCYKEKCMTPDPVEHRYAISVRYSLHNSTGGEQTLKEVWLRGSGPGLTWDRPIRMHKFEDEWRFEYTYTSDSFDRTCTRLDHCALIQRAVEFRVCADPLRLDPCEPSQFKRQLFSCTVAHPCGQNAEEFLEMIELRVFPLIQELTQNRVHLDSPRHRATITGYRSGGLFACWAALRRPDLFQNAACLSPSVYLGIREGRPMYELKKEIARTAAKATGNRPLKLLHSTQNYYIDIGERDSKPFPIYDAYQDTFDVVEDLKHHFHFRLGVNLHFNVFPKYSAAEGQHHYNTINNDIPYFHRLLYPLLAFFRPIGGGSRDSSRAPKLEELHFVEWEIQLQKKLLPSLSEEDSSDDTLDIKLVAVKNTSSTPAPPIRTCNNGAISMPVYLCSLAATVVIVSSVTAALICLRSANKSAGRKQELDAEEDVEDDSCLDDSM